MGMYAVYQEINKDEFDNLLQDKDIFERVEELQNNNELLICDIGKMWDALHFILTKKSAVEPIENNLLSESIVGEIVSSSEEFIAITSNKKIADISNELQKLDFDYYLQNFDIKAFKKNDIYPNIWDDDDKEELEDEIRDAFELLKDFYQNVASNNTYVVVSIY